MDKDKPRDQQLKWVTCREFSAILWDEFSATAKLKFGPGGNPKALTEAVNDWIAKQREKSK